MASKINADEFVDREGEGKPTLPKGVVLSGVTTITTAVVAENEVANSTGINAGIITSTHFAGNLTGDVNAGIVTVTSQTVVGSAVTISASGIDIGAGVITATSYAGGGGNLTGIGATIMVWEYNPEIDSTTASSSTGIGITFNQKIKAGSGNITIRTGGFDGTVVENFGIGSSVTISANSLSLTPTSSLSNNTTHYVTLPSGVITNMAGDSYVGTEFSFKVPYNDYALWMWGEDTLGQLGQNSIIAAPGGYSSPVQVPGSWTYNIAMDNPNATVASKSNGTMWAWGSNAYGALGLNQGHALRISSPTQIPGTTWDKVVMASSATAATKTDGTLWSWGANGQGTAGQNDRTNRSSPVQIPGTTWGMLHANASTFYSVKTDGTLWGVGGGGNGQMGLNLADGPSSGHGAVSSPTQIPGTGWSTDSKKWGGQYYSVVTIKTDGTMWAWGQNSGGNLGQNQGYPAQYSSPVQVGSDTTWKYVTGANSGYTAAIKTDGTLWVWGSQNDVGTLGLNQASGAYSSPVQIPGTTWDKIDGGKYSINATKTDGTMWTWGDNEHGMLGLNQAAAGDGITSHALSSPVQVPGTWAYPLAGGYGDFHGGLKEI